MDERLKANTAWVNKIEIEVQENDDGSCNLLFMWDEKDPDLQLWTELGEEKQREFFLEVFENTLKTSVRQDTEPCSEE
jgi:hypothetical protein